MRKTKKVKLSTLLLLTLIPIILLVSIIVLIIINGKKNKEQTYYSDIDNEKWEEERFIKNNWDTTIVGDISHDIPIPNGFKYVQGDISTGIFVSNESLGIEMLWIPYNENAKEINVDQYFKNIDYYKIESDIVKSIEKYGGFYTTLYTSMEYKELKDISKEKYDELNETINFNNMIYTVNSHVLYKEEIQQIEYYLKNNNIGYLLGTTGITIEQYSTIYKNKKVQTSNIEQEIAKFASTEETNLNEMAEIYMLDTNAYETKVPIPLGFKYTVDEKGIVSIQNENNKNLVYVWVPISKENWGNTKSELRNLYSNWTNSEGEKLNLEEGTELYNVLNNGNETLSNEFRESIEKYSGFYISEAELSYDKNGNFYNKARGMIGSDVGKTKSGGDYYRKSSDYVSMEYSNMMQIASKVEENNSSVVSHLMYGIEYDATVLWISKTYSNFKDSKSNDIVTTLIYDSTNVGKYNNSNYKANSSAIETGEFFNGIWGLAGNLSEVTQERINEEYILRGGSYATTGQAAPMASRKISATTSSQDIGFRVALYVKPNATEVEQAYSTFEKDTEADYNDEVAIDNISGNENNTSSNTDNNTGNNKNSEENTSSNTDVNIDSLNINIKYDKTAVKFDETFKIVITCPEGYGVSECYTINPTTNENSYKVQKESNVKENVAIFTGTGKENGTRTLGFSIKDLSTGKIIGKVNGKTVKVSSYSVSVSKNEIQLGEIIDITISNLPDGWTWNYGLSNSTGIGLNVDKVNNNTLSLYGIKCGTTEVSIYFYNKEKKNVNTIKKSIKVLIPDVEYYYFENRANGDYYGERLQGNKLKVGDEIIMKFYIGKDFVVNCSTSNNNVLKYIWGSGSNATAGYRSGRFTAKEAGNANWTITWKRNGIECVSITNSFEVFKNMKK